MEAHPRSRNGLRRHPSPLSLRLKTEQSFPTSISGLISSLKRWKACMFVPSRRPYLAETEEPSLHLFLFSLLLFSPHHSSPLLTFPLPLLGRYTGGLSGLHFLICSCVRLPAGWVTGWRFCCYCTAALAHRYDHNCYESNVGSLSEKCLQFLLTVNYTENCRNAQHKLPADAFNVLLCLTNNLKPKEIHFNIREDKEVK